MISRLDIRNDWVIKGIEFEGVKKIGKINEIIDRYSTRWDIHEWMIFDSVSSLYNRSSTLLNSSDFFLGIDVPLMFGGGIGSKEVAEKLFETGADRIFLNSRCILNPDILVELSEKYGRQAICVMVEAKKSLNGWEALYLSGREKSGKTVFEWVTELQRYGAGEVILVSVDQDGTLKGPDLELAKRVRDLVEVPLVYSGGVCSVREIEILDDVVGCDGVAIGSLLHFHPSIVSDIHKIYPR